MSKVGITYFTPVHTETKYSEGERVMSAYIYQTRVDYSKIDNVLDSVKETVSHLKRENPELAHCSLADVGVTKQPNWIDITLYFQKRK